jgi:NAD(P)-dependent dehydrogenase (short-subunit alcohol dehydrogenase family)
MANTQKTVIVTGASQGLGAAVVRAFLERGYNVVGTLGARQSRLS